MSTEAPGNGEALRSFPVVASIDDLHEIVTAAREAGAFAFDVETRGIIERHPDVEVMLERAWATHVASLKVRNEAIIARSREAVEVKFRKMLALDPLRNEVFWLSIAVDGQSWAIPMGHRRGTVIVPAEIGDGTTTPPEGYRKFLASGKESMAKAKYMVPAVTTEPPAQLNRSEVFSVLKPLFMDDSILKIGHNVKFDARSIRKYLGQIPPGPYMDTMILQFVLNENLREYSLESLISKNFESHAPYAREGKVGKIIDDVPFDVAARYVHLDARWTWMLYKILYKKVKGRPGLENALSLDMDVLHTLMHMEDDGIHVDQRAMIKLGKELEHRQQELLLDISYHTFLGFNPGSNAHKQKLLFGLKRDGGLALKSTKLTKSGALVKDTVERRLPKYQSVDSDALEVLKGKHPVVPLLLEWSEAEKIKTTYVDGLLPRINHHRLHPSFNLHRVQTGRLSASEPNLQNIPRESDLRELFICGADEKLLVADYDQVELRVMCMFSHDKKMSAFFLNGIDIHSGAASLILRKPVDEVTGEERQMGKMVNFLTGFGGGAFNLSQKTGIPEEQAQEFIDNYFKQFSELAAWKEEVKAKARRMGYVETMSGRRRRLLDINHPDKKLRYRAERQAVNAVIQGTAADICKEAMVRVNRSFEGTDARLLVQVHDELLCSAPRDEADGYLEVLMSAMGHGTVIEGIPLLVSAHTGYSWAEAKG